MNFETFVLVWLGLLAAGLLCTWYYAWGVTAHIRKVWFDRLERQRLDHNRIWESIDRLEAHCGTSDEDIGDDGDCSECEEKDDEIAYLEAEIESLEDRLKDAEAERDKNGWSNLFGREYEYRIQGTPYGSWNVSLFLDGSCVRTETGNDLGAALGKLGNW